MNLKQQIDQELRRLAAAGPRGATQTLSVEGDGGRLDCEMTDVHPLACAFTRFAWSSDKLAGATIDDLRRVSESLSERLSYLLEPIHPIEIDKEGCVVQMRSQPPSQEEGQTSYYELSVRKGEIALCRWRRATGQPRTAIEAQVTAEVFHRLARDLAAAAETA